ncbi:MAG: glutamate--cysteine ligase [Oligoflexia bacterium]|nr:glutamate--cysteine ligase [Oligoflexia bacterium]
MSPSPCLNSKELRCDIVDRIFAHQEEIDAFLARQNLEAPAPPYTSIDLRDSGYKISPVDSNIFPAGFNNICVDDWRLASETLEKVLTERNHGLRPEKVIILSENHSSNLFYFENLWALKEILSLSGIQVTLGHLNTELEPNAPLGCTELLTANKRKIVLERVFREGSLLRTERQSFKKTDLILLNNDLSTGIPQELENIEQTLTPHPALGWHKRLKSEHLKHYTNLATDFAKIIGIDPWHLTTSFASVDGVDFSQGSGLDKLAQKVETVLDEIRKGYREREITVVPHVFIKHNSGTYGRSIMTARSGDDVLQMNRREKNKMHVSKGGVQVSSVVIMEGIPTNLREDDQTAEPVIYLAGNEPIGGFLRLNPNRDDQSNLNSPGAHFKTLCFANLFRDPSREMIILEKLYGALGKLSTLANGREIQ